MLITSKCLSLLSKHTTEVIYVNHNQYANTTGQQSLNMMHNYVS